MEDTQVTKSFPSHDELESSTRKKASKSVKIRRLKDKIVEYEVLERVIKSKYEILTQTSVETRSAFERLALMHVKERKKKKRVIKKNYKLTKKIRFLNIKMKFLKAKLTTHLELEVLVETTEKLHEDSSR